jgi:hypothetical protein
MFIKVQIFCSGFGNERREDVFLTMEDVGQLAIEKLKETDASPKMEWVTVNVSFDDEI